MARNFSKRFYRSALWQKTREQILRRDKYLCQRCRSTGDLEVHHIERLTPENINDPRIALSPENLITLCRACHMAEHEGERIEATSEGACGAGMRFDADGYLVEE